MKHGKTYKWYKIAEQVSELHFKENSLLQIEVAGKEICIAKTGNSIAACTSKCPHAGGNMCEGFLDKNENIICPVHRYIFNLANGRDISGEGYFLKIYPVKISEEGIFVGFEEGGLLRWFK